MFYVMENDQRVRVAQQASPQNKQRAPALI